jgi:hypothetical protein
VVRSGCRRTIVGPSAIRKSSRKYPGVTADIEFDKNGDLTHGLLTIFQVKNGKWEVVSK